MEPPTPPPVRRRLARALTRARRAVLRRRRILAALLVGVAVLTALRSLAPPAPASATVTVAARDLPAGARLGPDDLTTSRVPPDALPDRVVQAPLGRTLAAPLTRGEPVTEPRLVGAHLVDAAPGLTAVPLRISDPGQVALLTVGDRIDLLATDPSHTTTARIATGVEVLVVPPGSGQDGGNLTGRLVVVAVPTEEVEEVTAAAVASVVTFSWVSD